MSAETIPSDVVTDLDCIRWYVECLDAVAFKRRAVAGLAEAEGSYNAAMKRLADRSTRPAEPAAPVAEAGDGECPDCGSPLNSDGECTLDLAVQEADDFAEAQHQIARLTREKEAERARADAAEARIVELEAVEKTLRWSVSDSEASLAAAEQRAADALARAEKAERRSAQPIIDGLSLANAKALVELFGGDETDMTVEFIPEGHSGPGFYAWCTEYPEDGSDFIGPASEFSSRASREAQPATDGGDNG